MNKLFQILCVFFLLVSACTKPEILPKESTEARTEAFARGELREPGQPNFEPFRVDIGPAGDTLDYIFWQSDVSLGELGPTLLTGAYATDLITSRPIVGFQFWSDELPDDRLWTGPELEEFFAPGTTFDFGEGPGRVDVAVLLPLSATFLDYDFLPSKPSYLADPQGTLTITGIEDIAYDPYLVVDDSRQGKLISCTFSGELGRYDGLADQADGYPGFDTDEVVEVRNGEAVFFVRTN